MKTDRFLIVMVVVNACQLYTRIRNRDLMDCVRFVFFRITSSVGYNISWQIIQQMSLFDETPSDWLSWVTACGSAGSHPSRFVGWTAARLTHSLDSTPHV
jgi:hypothetical protein